ncbi:hypothetical protein FNV43_RR14579 [Rhamnella rubrinervis]|uniref:Uncharacterized protein n=1 Tax=Rhamnella rubrinervis TaxID=2594499 RepID=A0A8K0H329_9ROSA|nr:hypothetical protein FNV43_RR14579 [Rhamnella rubrinervis]
MSLVNSRGGATVNGYVVLRTVSGAAAAYGTISSMEGNGTTTIDIILVSDQYAELELQHMMESETNRILEGPDFITTNTFDANARFSCRGPHLPCLGLPTDSLKGHCAPYTRDCHQVKR